MAPLFYFPRKLKGTTWAHFFFLWYNKILIIVDHLVLNLLKNLLWKWLSKTLSIKYMEIYIFKKCSIQISAIQHLVVSKLIAHLTSAYWGSMSCPMIWGQNRKLKIKTKILCFHSGMGEKCTIQILWTKQKCITLLSLKRVNKVHT